MRRGESGISDEVSMEELHVCVFNLYHSERECFGFNLAFSNVSPAESMYLHDITERNLCQKCFFILSQPLRAIELVHSKNKTKIYK